mgnify:CR=1 FL=1
MGFIGSNLAYRLVNLGANVTLVDSLIPEYGGNLFNIVNFQEKINKKFQIKKKKGANPVKLLLINIST